MKFYIVKKRKKFLDYFKPRKKIEINCKRTLGKILGIGGGYKTKIVSNEQLADDGETKRIVELLAKAARERRLEVPFALSYRIIDELQDYEIEVNSHWLTLNRELKESGLKKISSGTFAIDD